MYKLSGIFWSRQEAKTYILIAKLIIVHFLSPSAWMNNKLRKPCIKHIVLWKLRGVFFSFEEEECEESMYEAVNQETEPKIDEAACYASDDSSADSLDDLSETDFSSKVTFHYGHHHASSGFWSSTLVWSSSLPLSSFMASGSQVLRENLTASSYHHQGTDTGFFLVWDAPIRNDFNLVSCLFFFGRILLASESCRST